MNLSEIMKRIYNRKLSKVEKKVATELLSRYMSDNDIDYEGESQPEVNFYVELFLAGWVAHEVMTEEI